MWNLFFSCAQKCWCVQIQQLFEMITLHIQLLFFGSLEEWSVITAQQMFWHTINWRKNILIKWKAWASITRYSECTFFMTFEIIFWAIRGSCFRGTIFWIWAGFDYACWRINLNIIAWCSRCRWSMQFPIKKRAQTQCSGNNDKCNHSWD